MKKSAFKHIVFTYTRKIGESFNTMLNAIGKKYDLTSMQVRILMELYHHGSHTIGQLAERLYVAGANLSTMCKKLEKIGLVERNRDHDDERIVRIDLSEQGKLITREIDQYLDEKISTAMENVSQEDLSEIAEGVIRLERLLQKSIHEEKE